MIVTAGKTNVSVYFYIVGDAGHATPGEPVTGLLFSDIETGGSASYVRQGAARVDLTLVTLASASAAHADGGFILVDDTNLPGVYRCDFPDAAFATGVDEVILGLVVAAAKNAVAAPIKVQILDVDLRDAVRAGMTALPNAAANAAGGLPVSTAGALDLDALNTAAVRLTAARAAVLDDWINAGRLDAILDIIAADVVNIDGAAMRGTDSAALASEVTAARMATLTDWIDGGRLDLLLDAIPTTAMRGTDGALTDKDGFTLSTAGILAVWHQALTAVVTAGSVGKLIKDEVTAVRMAVLTDWINGGRLDLLLDAIPTTAMRGTDNAALASVATEARLAELDAANLPADVDQIKTDTTTDIPALIAALNDLSAAGAADAVWDELRSGHKISGSYGESFYVMASGTAATGTLSTVAMQSTIVELTDDHFVGRTVIFIDGVLHLQGATVDGYTGIDGIFGFANNPLTEAPVNGQRFIVV